MVSLIVMIVIGYWASIQISEQGAEERFHSAVGLEREEECAETKSILPIEVENIYLFLILTLATVAFGIVACHATARKGRE